MAINKVGSKGIEDGSVAAVDFAPGTVTDVKLNATQNLSSKTITLPNTSVTSGMLAGSIGNDKLANSSITASGTAVALGASITLNNEFVDWQSVITSNTTMVAGRGYFVNTTGGAVSMTLPASATIGDLVVIKDYAGTFATNNLTIQRNGHNVQGNAGDISVSTNRASLVLVYVDSTKGWLFTDEHNVADLQGPKFTTATGGTVATSGNFKIHSFTGDGNFVVSSLGNSPTVPTGGPVNVDYLVVAGGAAGGQLAGGGGGAGGYRTTFPSPSCNAGAFAVTATTFPITVGAGGAGGATPGCATAGNSGSNSVFSTITSTGGGVGGNNNGAANAASGGSGGGTGGGGSNTGPVTAGSGNTPPVSPSQGNNGGTLSPTTRSGNGPAYGAAGGGGAGGVGGNGGNNNGGPGGAGSANSVTGSSVTYSGGGGGGNFGIGSGAPGAPVGPPGGGSGGPNSAPGNGTDGVANRGGGGGGGTYAPGNVGYGGAGGKGIVIIRYKFQ